MKPDRQAIYDKLNGHCAYCGETIELKDMQVDHVIPKSNFDRYKKNNNYRVPEFLHHLSIDECNHMDNLFPSCRKCNNFKASFDLELFRYELSQQIVRLNKTSANYRTAKRFGQIQETIHPIVFYFEQRKEEQK